MTFDQSNIQKIRESMGDAEFIRVVESELAGAKERVKEKENAQKTINDKIEDIYEFITTDNITCDKEQLKAFLLNQLNSKYAPVADVSVSLLNNDAKRQKVQPKYKYKLENGEDKTWSGRGGIPVELKSIIKQEMEKKGISEMTSEVKKEVLSSYLINKDD